MKTGVLMVVDWLGVGGVEQVVKNISLGLDKNIFKVYIYVLNAVPEHHKQELMDKEIVVVDDYQQKLNQCGYNKHVLLYKEIKAFLNYYKDISVVHVHCASQEIEVLIAAKLNHIPVICMHSHMAYSNYWNPKKFSLKSKIALPIHNLFVRTIPNYKIGCSEVACRNKYGSSKGQYFIPNGVDLSKFNVERLSSKSELLKKYDMVDTGHNFLFVGRFSQQKNPLFLINVFRYIVDVISDAKLTLVGYGELEDDIKTLVKKKNLCDSIVFLPPESNVPELLKVSDFFILPSIGEGLGIVFVEAQLMGVPAFASDQVPKDANLGLCEFVPLKLGAEEYANFVVNYIKENKRANRCLDQKKVRQYDMQEVIKLYEKIYLQEK